MPLLEPHAFVNRKDENAYGECEIEALNVVLIPLSACLLVLPTHNYAGNMFEVMHFSFISVCFFFLKIHHYGWFGSCRNLFQYSPFWFLVCTNPSIGWKLWGGRLGIFYIFIYLSCGDTCVQKENILFVSRYFLRRIISVWTSSSFSMLC